SRRRVCPARGFQGRYWVSAALARAPIGEPSFGAAQIGVLRAGWALSPLPARPVPSLAPPAPEPGGAALGAAGHALGYEPTPCASGAARPFGASDCCAEPSLGTEAAILPRPSCWSSTTTTTMTTASPTGQQAPSANAPWTACRGSGTNSSRQLGVSPR